MLKPSLAISQEEVFKDFYSNFKIDKKRILEIGGCLPYEIVQPSKVNTWIAVDPRNQNNKQTDKYQTICGYSQLIPTPDEFFDFIFSCNAFQHINNFEMALDEMYRVLKPGGILYSNFGPIWSAPDGSHLEDIRYKDKVYNFWEDSLIPNWYHLIYNCQELYKIMSSRLDNGLAQVLSEYIFMSGWLNRMTYFDFKKAVDRSKFKEVLFFDGSKELGYSRYEHIYINHLLDKEVDWKIQNYDQMEYYRIRDLKICLLK